MAKRTVVDIDQLKSAQHDLETLLNDMQQSGGAAQYAPDVATVSAGLGPLLEGAGQSISQYVDARSTRIMQVHQQSIQGVSTALSLLTQTITNYETNEQTHRGAADGTDTTGSGGNGGNGGGRGKG